MKPKYVHDCDHCDFLGHAMGKDLYIHLNNREGGMLGSVVVRRSSEGSEYCSTPIEMLLDRVKGGFRIRDHTVKPPIDTNVPFTDTALQILALALAREKGLTQWRAA